MCFLMFAMGIDEDQDMFIFGHNDACMAQVWLYAVGFALVIDALVVKTIRIRMSFNGAKVLKRKTITVMDMMPLFALVVAVEIGIMLAWQFSSPLEYQRDVDSIQDRPGDVIESQGTCTSPNALPYLGSVLLFKGLVCLVGVISQRDFGVMQRN